MWIVSIVALCIVMALCVLGTFGRWYSDNLAQRIGMAMLSSDAGRRSRN